MFRDDFCEKLGRYPKLIHKHYPQFVVVQMVGDSASKLVRLDVDTDHFEMMLTTIAEKETYYGWATTTPDRKGLSGIGSERSSSSSGRTASSVRKT